jgi:ABC-type Zn uptake system ZnuABC Zn-binding protein ZnuA
MQHLIRRTLAAAAALSLAAAASAQLRVVATIPDLADVAREIGGDLVDVKTIAKGTENVHSVSIRPSDLVAVNRADVLIQVGLSLEHAYVPGLIEKARNKRILPGAPGFVDCSEGWEAIDVPDEISRGAAADVHPLGNPHMNLDPRAGRHLAERIREGLARADPEHAEAYAQNHAAYVRKLDVAEKRWAELGAKLKGAKVALYHRDFTYFARRYGMEVVATVEPKPGVPPSPRDLAGIVEVLRREEVKLVLTAKWSNNKDVRFVADKAGARVLEIPILVGGVAGADSWIDMMDVLHTSLVDALAKDG